MIVLEKLSYPNITCTMAPNYHWKQFHRLHLWHGGNSWIIIIVRLFIHLPPNSSDYGVLYSLSNYCQSSVRLSDLGLDNSFSVGKCGRNVWNIGEPIYLRNLTKSFQVLIIHNTLSSHDFFSLMKHAGMSYYFVLFCQLLLFLWRQNVSLLSAVWKLRVYLIFPSVMKWQQFQSVMYICIKVGYFLKKSKT